MHKIRLMIADDHALVLDGISAILSLCDDMEVVAKATNGNEAVDLCMKHKPDIALMDISMPGLGGLEATAEIKKLRPETRIIVLTQYDDREYVSRFLKLGVSGYILKKAIGGELLSAIRAVARGESYLYPSIASSVINGYLDKDGLKGEVPYEKLTDRERQVLKLLAEGMSHKEIAGTLGISVKTVIAHQSNISEKLDIHSRVGLIKFAIQKGLIKLD